MDWWWILLILIVVILLLWWALRKNAGETEFPARHEEESPVKATINAPVINEPAVNASIPAEIRSAEISTQAAEDDLEIIEGIGPKISLILKEAGISTFAQLANEEPTNLKNLLEKAGLRLGDPTTWPKQAKLAAEGNLEELQKLQDSLKGGRVVS
jgi:predicted flap endonuclease-1-like 5' DNA nuclease